MSKTSILSFYNLKKLKGQYFSFGIILMLTAIILNISLVLNFQMDNAYDDTFDKYNTANINVCIPKIQDDNYDGNLKKIIGKIDGVEEVEKHEAVYVSAIVKDFNGTDFTMNTVFYNINKDKSMNKYEITEENDNSENNIYLPLYMSRMGGFNLDDNITYTITTNNAENDTKKEKDYEYKVAGIIEEMQYGNYGVGFMDAYLTDKEYKKLADKNENSVVTEYSIKASDGTSVSELKNKISEALEDEEVNMLFICDNETGKQSRTMVCNLVIMIMLAFSVIILLVSTFLCKFRVQNTIDEEVTNMGVLKAIGYTGNMIISSQIQPYLLTGIIASVAGSLLSYTVLPVISEMLAIQSGFSFEPDFHVVSMLITVIFINIVILIFTYMASRKIRKLEPINAIRKIIAPNKKDKNHVPLDTTPGNIHVNLILKQTASSPRQNVLLFFVSFVIMVLLVFAGSLFYNVNIKSDNFTKALSEECPSVIINVEPDEHKDMVKILEKDDDVEKILEYSILGVKYEDGSMNALVCEDFSQVTNDICYDGKNPENADEIAIGNSVGEDYKIGDKIKITVDDKSFEYTITGFVQSVNNNGVLCELTQKGYKKLVKNAEFHTLNIYLNNDADVQNFVDDYEKEYEDEIKSIVNYDNVSTTLRKTYSTIITIVVFAILLLTILIVLLIMYVIIKSLIVRRKQEFGIYKAIGYTSTQLIWQVVFGFFPVTFISSLISALLGIFYLPVINDAIFSIIGVVKNNFEISVGFLLLCVLILTVVNLIISILLSLPIKKISAYSLIKE